MTVPNVTLHPLIRQCYDRWRWLVSRVQSVNAEIADFMYDDTWEQKTRRRFSIEISRIGRWLVSHPFILAVVTMTLATLSYAPLFGWHVAIALVLVLLVHELGHVAVAWLLKLPPQLLVFVPFLGAFVTLKAEPRIVEHDAAFALGGPAAGAVFALGCAVAAVSTGNADMAALGRIGGFLNLLNLIPLPPLDGSRVLAVVSPRLGMLGVPMFGALLWWHFSFDFLLIAAISLPLLYEVLREDHGDRETIAFYAAPPSQQIATVIAYLVTIATLVLSFALANGARD